MNKLIILLLTLIISLSFTLATIYMDSIILNISFKYAFKNFIFYIFIYFSILGGSLYLISWFEGLFKEEEKREIPKREKFIKKKKSKPKRIDSKEKENSFTIIDGEKIYFD